MRTALRTRRLRGATLTEVMVASVISSFVILGSLMTYVSGIQSWTRGMERMDVEGDSSGTVRLIADALREAMIVTVDANGLGLTYFVPERNPDGTFRTDGRGQPVSDGIARRVFHQSGQIRFQDPEGIRIVATNVILTDPHTAGGNGAYRIFTPNAGAMVRQITVMVVTRRRSADLTFKHGRKRETIFLRNVADTTR